jgi:hypothetical protein
VIPANQSIERGKKEMLLGQQLPMIQFQSGVWLDKKPLNRMMTSSTIRMMTSSLAF